MTLDQEFQQYQEQSVLVPGEPEGERGQCVQWADYVLHDVYKLPYHYGNAIDWWNNPKELLNESFIKITDGSIKKGDFVIWDNRVGSIYGHIGVAAQDGVKANFISYDSNWGDSLKVQEIHHNDGYNNYILGSLRLKGDEPMADDNITKLEFGVRLGRAPSQADLDSWRGRPTNLLITSLAASDEGHAHYNYITQATAFYEKYKNSPPSPNAEVLKPNTLYKTQ